MSSCKPNSRLKLCHKQDGDRGWELRSPEQQAAELQEPEVLKDKWLSKVKHSSVYIKVLSMYLFIDKVQKSPVKSF